MIRLLFKDNQAGRKLEVGMRREADRVRRALMRTALEAARIIENLGRADIRAAGRFGRRWTEGLRATPLVNDATGDVVVRTTSDVPYFNIFEFGGVIRGRPLLWIPLSFAKDAQGVRARDYPAPLFRVDRISGGAPLLLSAADGQPKYFGKESVTIPKKFRIRQIIAETSRSLRDIYRRMFVSEKR